MMDSSSSTTTTPTNTPTTDENSSSQHIVDNDSTTPTGPEKPALVPKSANAFSKPSCLKPPTVYPLKGNISALLLNRNKNNGGKKPLTSKNPIVRAEAADKGSSKEPSTPANVKRLQVNKWFNSPTDNLFSPCTRKLYNVKKAAAIPLSTDPLIKDLSTNDEEEKAADENATAAETVEDEEAMME